MVEFTPPGDGIWMHESALFSGAVAPMSESLLYPSIARAMTRAFDEFGVPVERVDLAGVSGHPYLRLVPIVGGDRSLRSGSSLSILSRVSPSLAKTMGRAKKAEKEDLGGRLVERWWERDRSAARRQIDMHTKEDPAKLSNGELAFHLSRISEWQTHQAEVYFKLWVPSALATYRFETIAERDAKVDPHYLFGLLRGFAPSLTEPASVLVRLGRMVRAQGIVPLSMERLREVAPEVFAQVEGLASKLAMYPLTRDVAAEIVGERPDVLLHLLNHPNPEAALAPGTPRSEVESLVEGRRPVQRHRVLEAWSDLERLLAVEHDARVFALDLPIGVLSNVVAEAGIRLAALGVIGMPGDVHLLRKDEVLTLLSDKETPDLALAERGQAWAAAQSSVPPLLLGGGGMGEEGVVPEHALVEGVLWALRRERFSDAPLGVARGRHWGSARLVRNADDLARLEIGDVLVARSLPPGAELALGVIGAIVLERGGALSPGARAAREAGIPAVVGVADALAVIPDGAPLVVDGDQGSVKLR